MHEIKDGKMTVSTGIVFKIGEAAIYVLDAVRRKVKKEEPQVPVVYIKDKDRDEPNPNDPDYLKALAQWEENMTDKLTDASILMSVSVDKLPDGFPKVEDESWAKKLELLGIDIPDNPDERFLLWVKCCAAPTAEDIYSLFLACARKIGVPEEDVADSSALFRNRKKRGTNRRASD